ncbi:MAG: nucleotidyl transferase AbiEii/AbiGii toxin family protein [Acidimicrobiales bacterium]|nr:nucleotidyl transferase AbiEii/AbiGii toxin family protein [Acidimicrobiales bacterium]
MLSSFQEYVAKIISTLDEAKEFALAGGAALILRGDVERLTRDLDFFGISTSNVDQLVTAAIKALHDSGLEVEIIQMNHGFGRLEVKRGNDRVEIDIANDARLFPLEQYNLLPTLSGKELAVDKVLAIFGRAEPRDFIDLFSIESKYGLGNLCRLAIEKDPKFSFEVFGEMLSSFSRFPRREFDLDDSNFELLRDRVNTWRELIISPHFMNTID